MPPRRYALTPAGSRSRSWLATLRSPGSASFMRCDLDHSAERPEHARNGLREDPRLPLHHLSGRLLATTAAEPMLHSGCAALQPLHKLDEELVHGWTLARDGLAPPASSCPADASACRAGRRYSPDRRRHSRSDPSSPSFACFRRTSPRRRSDRSTRWNGLREDPRLILRHGTGRSIAWGEPDRADARGPSRSPRRWRAPARRHPRLLPSSRRRWSPSPSTRWGPVRCRC